MSLVSLMIGRRIKGVAVNGLKESPRLNHVIFASIQYFRLRVELSSTSESLLTMSFDSDGFD